MGQELATETQERKHGDRVSDQSERRNQDIVSARHTFSPKSCSSSRSPSLLSSRKSIVLVPRLENSIFIPSSPSAHRISLFKGKGSAVRHAHPHPANYVSRVTTFVLYSQVHCNNNTTGLFFWDGRSFAFTECPETRNRSAVHSTFDPCVRAQAEAGERRRAGKLVLLLLSQEGRRVSGRSGARENSQHESFSISVLISRIQITRFLPAILLTLSFLYE